MLIGRSGERAQIAQMLREARAGQSQVLVLTGDAGVGKSALLDHAAAIADGFRVVRIRGVESEAELAFGALYELCRPLVDWLDRLEQPQASVLRTTFGADGGSPATGFAIGAATLTLVATVAEDVPLAVLIDDAHWLDQGSSEAIAFAVRRLEADAVAVLIATRPADGRPFLGRDFPELVVAGLDRASAIRLLEGTANRQLDPIERDLLLDLSAGNPLALSELPRQLDSHGVGPEPIRLTARLERAFAARAEALPTKTRQALVVTAAAGTNDAVALGNALNALHLRYDDLEPAEATGLVSLGGGAPEFRHPLVRSAIYHAAPPSQRRRAHKAIADASAGDRAAWHLAASAAGPDDDAAAAMDRAAESALSRSGYASAAVAFERAARLSTQAAHRVHRLTAGADAAWLAGRTERALGLIAEALESTDDQLLRGRLLHTRGSIEHFVGDAAQAHLTLEAAAELLAAVDPRQASLSLTEAVGSALFTGEVGRAVELGARAVEIARDGHDDQLLFASVPRGASLLLAGQMDEARPYLQRAAEAASGASLTGDPRNLVWAALAGWWVNDGPLMSSKAAAAMEWARSHSALAAMPWAAMLLGLGHIIEGRWREARAALLEGADAGRLTAQEGHLAMLLSMLAWLEGATGNMEASRACLDEGLAIADRRGLAWIRNWLLRAYVVQELGAGLEREPVGVEMLRRSLAERPLRDPPATAAWPDLLEALVRLGELDAARDLLARHGPEAERLGHPYGLAVVARCRGLLAEPGEIDAQFLRALSFHALSQNPFETARTQLVFGERLRRAGRRVDAREQLHVALETFERLGAAPWAERARSELRATGQRLRRRAATRDALTEQELQVAVLVAEGRSNQEVGATLFLSPKTVEWHLGHVYAKVGVSSRGQLARALSRAIEPDGPDGGERDRRS